MASSVAPNERRAITSAIAALIYQDQTFLEHGITFDDLVAAAHALEPKYTKKQMELVVTREMASGSLVKLQNGNLALGPADHDADSSDSFKLEYSAEFSNTKVCFSFFW